MKKLASLIAIVAVVAVVTFSTIQMFAGNFEAAFSSLPFLLILYLFLKKLE